MWAPATVQSLHLPPNVHTSTCDDQGRKPAAPAAWKSVSAPHHQPRSHVTDPWLPYDHLEGHHSQEEAASQHMLTILACMCSITSITLWMSVNRHQLQLTQLARSRLDRQGRHHPTVAQDVLVKTGTPVRTCQRATRSPGHTKWLVMQHTQAWPGTGPVTVVELSCTLCSAWQSQAWHQPRSLPPTKPNYNAVQLGRQPGRMHARHCTTQHPQSCSIANNQTVMWSR